MGLLNELDRIIQGGGPLEPARAIVYWRDASDPAWA